MTRPDEGGPDTALRPRRNDRSRPRRASGPCGFAMMTQQMTSTRSTGGFPVGTLRSPRGRRRSHVPGHGGGHQAEQARLQPHGNGGVPSSSGSVIPFDRPTRCGTEISTSKPLNVTDEPNSPVGSHPADGTVQAASVFSCRWPLGRGAAVIVLVSGTPRWFGEEEIEFAYTMANQASAGLGALEMRGRLAEQADRQTALARAASALTRAWTGARCSTPLRGGDRGAGADIGGAISATQSSGGMAVAANGIAGRSDSWGYGMARERAGRQALGTASRRSERRPGRDGGPRVEGSSRSRRPSPFRCSGTESSGRALVGLLSMRPGRGETSRRCRPSPAWRRWPAATPRPSSGHRGGPTDSLTGLLNQGLSRCGRARRSADPSAPSGRSLPALRPRQLQADQRPPRAPDRRRDPEAGRERCREEFRAYDGIGRFRRRRIRGDPPSRTRARPWRRPTSAACVDRAAGQLQELGRR